MGNPKNYQVDLCWVMYYNVTVVYCESFFLNREGVD